MPCLRDVRRSSSGSLARPSAVAAGIVASRVRDSSPSRSTRGTRALRVLLSRALRAIPTAMPTKRVARRSRTHDHVPHSPLVASICTAKICGGDSDCAACVERRGQVRFKESRKHAGSTRRCQIFSIRLGAVLPHPEIPPLPAQIARLPRSLNPRPEHTPALFLVIMQTRNQSCQWGRTEFFRGSSRGRGEAGISIRLSGFRGARSGDIPALRRRAAADRGDPGLRTPLPSWWPSPGGPADRRNRVAARAISQALKRPIVPINPVSMGSVANLRSWRIGGQHVECASVSSRLAMSGPRRTGRPVRMVGPDQVDLDPLVPMPPIRQ